MKNLSRNSITPAVFFIFLALLFGSNRAFAQQAGALLVYQQSGSSSAEVMEVRSYRQDNALYSTAVTTSGERKQLKAADVIAVLPEPPSSFNADFATTAHAELAKINAFAAAHPAIKDRLDELSGRWSRALKVFEQEQRRATSVATTATTPSPPPVLVLREGAFRNPRVTQATPDEVTIAHAAGISKVPMEELTGPQILLLNRQSDSIQLPFAITSASSSTHSTSTSIADDESPLTQRIAAIGASAVDFCAAHLSISEKTVRTWALFVVFPALLLLLLLGLIVSLVRARS